MNKSSLKKIIIEQKVKIVNARQAAKAAAKQIEILEHYNACASADIKAYNVVIAEMIKGACPCKWCEDFQECTTEKEGYGITGCEDWMLKFDHGLMEEQRHE